MAKPRTERLAAAVKIRPGETAVAVLFFLYFFLVTAPFNVIKSIRDASFLDELGAKSLPYAYATAILIGAVVALHSRLQARFSRRSLLLGSLAFFAASAALFGGLFARGETWFGAGFREWLPLPFYLWVTVFSVVLVTQFWFCVNDVFNPREAKRLIGFFGSGGILGGIAGGMVTAFLARRLKTPGLLFLSAGLLLACLAVVGLLFRERRRIGKTAPAEGSIAEAPPSAKIGFGACWESVRANPYLLLLAAVVFAAGVVSTFIDWEAKTVIEGNIARGVGRTAFFGLLNAGFLVLAFLFQLVLTSRVIDRFGLRRGLMIYPALLFLGVGGIALAPAAGALAVAVVVKGADKALSYSINQSCRELLYIPVPQGLKYRAKAFIDMFVNRFSRAAGGLFLFALILPLGEKRAMTWALGLTLAAILAWGVLNLRLGREYVQTVKEQLGRTWERGDEVVGGEIDVETAKLIVDALESKSRSSTLYALHLFDLLRSGRMTPEVGGLLASGVADAASPTRNPLWETDEIPWMPDLAETLPADVLDLNIREIMALPDYRALMGDYARRVSEDPDTASLTAKMELAKAAGLMGADAPAALSLADLLREESPDVIRFAAASAGTLRRREFIDPLVAKLGDPRTREDARSALEKYGGRITGTLGDYLADPSVPSDIRREIASILAPAATQGAADELLDQLRGGTSGIEAELIDGLDRIRVRNPEVVFPGEVVGATILRYSVPRTDDKPADPLILFKLLGLLYPHGDVFRAYRSFLKGTKNDIAYAVELLDEMLPRDLKEKIIPVLEARG